MIIPRYNLNKNQDFIDFLKDDIRLNNIVQGDAIQDFTQKLKAALKVDNVNLTTNGFTAIFVLLKALNLKNSRVLVPACSSCYSYINAVLASDNIPVLCDIDLRNLDINSCIAKDLKYDSVIHVNHFGANLRLSRINIEENTPVIWDNAQAIGTLLKNQNIDLSENIHSILSFYPTKLISAGNGGAVLTSSIKLHDKISNMITYSHQTKLENHKIKYNFRLNNLNAKIGLYSLNNWDNLRIQRENIINTYDSVIGLFDFVNSLTLINPNIHPQKYICIFDQPQICDQFFNEMKNRNIEVSKELFYLGNREIMNEFPNSVFFEKIHCSIPLYGNLTKSEVNYITENLYDILRGING